MGNICSSSSEKRSVQEANLRNAITQLNEMTKRLDEIQFQDVTATIGAYEWTRVVYNTREAAIAYTLSMADDSHQPTLEYIDCTAADFATSPLVPIFTEELFQSLDMPKFKSPTNIGKTLIFELYKHVHSARARYVAILNGMGSGSVSSEIVPFTDNIVHAGNTRECVIGWIYVLDCLLATLKEFGPTGTTDREILARLKLELHTVFTSIDTLRKTVSFSPDPVLYELKHFRFTWPIFVTYVTAALILLD